MRHTLKAVFDHRSDAEHVLDELLASGYPRADMALVDLSTTAPGSSLRQTAARLLDVLHLRHAQQSGRHLVTLTTASDPDAERATGIITHHHPAGLEDLNDEGDAGLWTGTFVPRRDYPPGTAPGALQHRPHEDSRYFGTQNAYDPPAGNTFKETMGSIARWDNPDEDATRAAPAGDAHVRADAGRPDQTWEDVEPALKSDWERRHAGSEASAWDKVKLAMRHGWERMHH
jgi:hypothetical protein